MSHTLIEERRPKLCSLILRPQHRSMWYLEEFLGNKKDMYRPGGKFVQRGDAFSAGAWRTAAGGGKKHSHGFARPVFMGSFTWTLTDQAGVGHWVGGQLRNEDKQDRGRVRVRRQVLKAWGRAWPQSNQWPIQGSPKALSEEIAGPEITLEKSLKRDWNILGWPKSLPQHLMEKPERTFWPTQQILINQHSEFICQNSVKTRQHLFGDKCKHSYAPPKMFHLTCRSISWSRYSMALSTYSFLLENVSGILFPPGIIGTILPSALWPTKESRGIIWE